MCGRLTVSIKVDQLYANEGRVNGPTATSAPVNSGRAEPIDRLGLRRVPKRRAFQTRRFQDARIAREPQKKMEHSIDAINRVATARMSSAGISTAKQVKRLK